MIVNGVSNKDDSCFGRGKRLAFKGEV